MSILAPDGSPARQSGDRPARAKSWWQIYEAADRRDYRGWFYLPTLKPEEQLNSLTRGALNERIDFLYKNVPPVSNVIDGLAIEEAGTGLWPNWTSSNPKFNAALTDDFHYAVHEPRVFSADGETDYYTSQINVRRMIRLYGDGFGQLLFPSPGSIHPQCHLIPGWMCDGAPPGKTTKDGWRDGILRNRLGRAMSYWVPGQNGEPGVEVPASEMLHFHDLFLPGQTRGVSDLASVAKKMFRREDIAKALANGTLARERMGFALEEAPSKDGNSGPSADLDDLVGGDGESETVTREDGTGYRVKKLFGYDASESIQIPKLPPGTKIATVESSRPSDAVMEFQDSILAELCWAAKYPPEYIFFLSKMGQGTVARLVLIRVRDMVKVRRSTQLIPQFCNRWTVFHAWQLIKSGRYDRIGVPADWWKHETQADPDKSVDIGREGRMLDERVATGKMKIDTYHALQGEATRDVDASNFAVMARRLEELAAFNKQHGTTFTYFDMWPRTANQQIQLIASPSNSDE